jgi:hypothetical protein
VSTCNLTLTQELAPILSEENARRYRKLHLLDLNGWLRDDVLPKLEVKSRLGSIVLHPTCGCVQTGSDGAMLDVARRGGDGADPLELLRHRRRPRLPPPRADRRSSALRAGGGRLQELRRIRGALPSIGGLQHRYAWRQAAHCAVLGPADARDEF